jgi:hypothetical protein
MFVLDKSRRLALRFIRFFATKSSSDKGGEWVGFLQPRSGAAGLEKSDPLAQGLLTLVISWNPNKPQDKPAGF